jgi:hypothetical protein
MWIFVVLPPVCEQSSYMTDWWCQSTDGILAKLILVAAVDQFKDAGVQLLYLEGTPLLNNDQVPSCA